MPVDRARREPFPALPGDVVLEPADVERFERQAPELRDQVRLDDRRIALARRVLEALRIRVGREPLASEGLETDGLSVTEAFAANGDEAILQSLARLRPSPAFSLGAETLLQASALGVSIPDLPD